MPSALAERNDMRAGGTIENSIPLEVAEYSQTLHKFS